MKTNFNSLKNKFISSSIVLLCFLFFNNSIKAQEKFRTSDAKITVNGTSNIHDWVMTGSKGNVLANFLLEGKQLKALHSLSFSFVVENLKSEHKLMDKNCYKAMKTSVNPTITFTGTSATIKAIGNNTYQISCKGKLKISDVTRDVELVAIATVNAENSLSITGNFKLKMTDYKVEPPSIMMGSIVTGNDVSINYTMNLTK